MGTQAQQIWSWIGNNLWQIIVIGSLFIQIAPIKINPWTAIIKWIGKIIVGNTCEKIDKLLSEVRENEKDRIRWEILTFANSCHSGIKHTQDEFRHVIELNDKYRKLLEDTHDSNGVFNAEYGYIYDLYQKLTQQNAFIIIGGNEND